MEPLEEALYGLLYLGCATRFSRRIWLRQAMNPPSRLGLRLKLAWCVIILPQSWTELAMPSKYLFFVLAHQGKSSKITKFRCEWSLAGECMDLWPRRQAKMPGPIHSYRHTIIWQQQQCLELAADKKYAKASEFLGSLSLLGWMSTKRLCRTKTP